MNIFKATWHCIFSPRLYKVYGGPLEQVYEPTIMEKWGEQVLLMLNVMWQVGLYTSPVLMGFLYRKGYLVTENYVVVTKCFTTFGAIYIMSLFLRGIGRANNEIYQTFHQILYNAQQNMSVENKKQLSKYDFDFSAWPVEFQWSEIQNLVRKNRVSSGRSFANQSVLQQMVTVPCRIIGAVAVHSFGLRIIYPGSLSILQAMLSSALLQGRAKLVEENHGERFKLKSRDKNEIDVMFIDKRGEKTRNSSILVVCCEGNAGFYEIGVMNTPIAAGYSVIGWNHPGFAYSTGKPYPQQEQNAIEVVIEFAVHRLNFNVENIVLFAWSIGGYAATWAAMNYPNIKGVVLDATFDDILPLAIQYMPGWWESIVVVAIRNHVNLNNYENLSRYSGPILLIRRTDDEVICTIESNISTNRGNYLLLKLMQNRYPVIFGKEQKQLIIDYLAESSMHQDQLSMKFQVDQPLCTSLIQSYVSQHSKTYPLELGRDLDEDIKNQLALFLAQKYMKDYRSTHCTPLPVNMFSLPWTLTTDDELASN